MHRKWKGWIQAATVLALGIASVSAFGQTASGDWRTYGGSSAREGHNANPTSAWGPGRSFLRWWRPNTSDAAGSTYVIDNLPLTINATSVSATFPLGIWNQPATVADEAFNAYIPGVYSNADPATNPPYRFASTTLANAYTTPEVPQVAANHATAEWAFDFATLGDATARSYALYVWLPIGPTLVGGISKYQQRYFVYEVFYGTGQRFVDVVDSFAAGTGFVRLGGGGRANNVTFAYDGSTPIRVVLHNTVPLDENGNPTDSVGSTVVYADAAMAASQFGYYRASPIVSEFGAGGPANTHAVGALNTTNTAFVKLDSDPTKTTPITVTKGEVSSYDFATGLTRWVFDLLNESENVNFVDNLSAAVTPGLGWTSQTLPATFFGTDFFGAPITTTLGTETAVTYAPTLDAGSYEIWAWIPGDGGGVTFGHNVMYEVLEGATATQFTIDQSVNRGWVRIGTRRFNNNVVPGDALKLRITNYSAVGTDAGLTSYADAVKFVGASDLAVNSTPVNVDALVRLTPGGPLTSRSVTLIAGENGRLYCLDAAGNGNGKTQCLWTYPSTPDPNNSAWTDPNQVAGEDGSGPIAEMPTGFNLSSALVERIDGEDWLFIGASNGRVYKISMAGRGDMNNTLQLPGTTTRAWSYPNDYPSRALPGNLGPIEGSLAFATTAAGPTVFVPTTQGRMYALDARGNAATKTTTVRAGWPFPAKDQPTLGAIVGTPSIAFGNIYFGTQVKTGDDRGRFYAVNVDTGVATWQFNSNLAWETNPLNPNQQLASDFNSGPVTIPAAEMTGMPDTVVVANDNLWVTALDAGTGAVLWSTDEIGSPVVGNLSFTYQTAYDTIGNLLSAPVVLVPSVDGRIMSLFAQTGSTTVFGGNSRLAWGFETSGDLTAQVSVGRNWMYAADEAGTIFGFNDTSGGAVSPGPPPGREIVPPNDPRTIPFREAKIKFVTKDTYNRLREVSGSANHLSYAKAINDPSREVLRRGFEWGETIYAIVYDIPYELDSNPIPPGVSPQINFRFSVEGASVRNLTVSSKQFSSPAASPVSPTTGEVLDGYAITSFTLQGSGATALPPGEAEAAFSVNAQFTAGSNVVAVSTNPATSRRVFSIANPLGVATRFLSSGAADLPYSIGYTVNPDDPEALVNGSPDLSGTTKIESLVLTDFGMTSHGQPGNSLMGVYDRSMMYLLRGADARGQTRGLDGVRVTRNDLAWQGGAAAVFKGIDQTRYPLTEQLPVNFPNDSLDYPNITREFVSVVKDKFGNAENPLYSGVSLIAPSIGLGLDPTDPASRTLVATPLDIEVDVPQFQPPNRTQVADSNGGTPEAGYYGPMSVFVDSSGNGLLDRRGRREAFRTFWLGGSVAIDERIVVEDPVVDLGSLAEGAGYSPTAPGGIDFNPWTGLPEFVSMYKSFAVRNIGNTNMNHMRLAKASNLVGARPQSWGLFAPANHERSWMDTMWSMWSDIDATYALNFGGSNEVLLQKARVGDRAGTTLSPNPYRRANPFLDVSTAPVNPNPLYTPRDPRVAVTVPIGTPVGTYVTTIRVIEDEIGPPDESLALDANGRPLEPYSDPTFVLRFNVRESRITNFTTPKTAPMIHAGAVPAVQNFLYKNVQPTGFRDQAGQLLVAYASNAGAFNDPQPANAILNDQFRIYVATMNGNTPGPAQGQNPLRDLLGWTAPGTGRWFSQAAGPLPTQPVDTLFASAAGETVLPETVKFGAPSFPILGSTHPLTYATMNGAYLAFLGQAEKQTASGRVPETRIFLQRVLVDANGNVTLEGPWAMGFDPNTGKGRPAVVQADERATVFYAGSGTGSNTLYYAHFDGTSFAQPQPIQLGIGFESFGIPSVSARTYTGFDIPGSGITAGTPILEMTFTGKLRDRAHSEVYFARMRSDSRLVPVNAPGLRSPLVYLPRRTQERLVAEGETGTYHAAGLLWNPTTSDPANALVFEQAIGAGAPTNIELPGTRKYDRDTGKITFQTALGGTAYVDPTMGTVRFAGTMPSRNATILLSYTPKILRVSTSGGAAYTGPTGIFDFRQVGELSYWASRLNAAAGAADPVATDRYVFTYSRAAAGAGAAARPYLRTMRFGVQLPTAIHTQPNGNVTAISVTGMANTATSFYQVDPANGKVYFTAENEGRTVQITYTGVDEATGNALPAIQRELTVSMIGERAEGPVQIEQAVNESQLCSFPDLVAPGTSAVGDRRPNLIWMVFTSTRAGGPDIYIQAVAPKFTPAATNTGGK